jgi:hypothetical protein
MTRVTPIILVALLGFALVSGARPSTRVIGGSAIQVETAPWAVFVKQAAGSNTLQCSGSIVDSLHVLTAAHCVSDLSGAQASIDSLSIRAGISNYSAPLGGDAEQDRAVSSLRVHPGYSWSKGVSDDDVAVLALSAPLDLGGAAVKPVALPRPGAAFPARAAVALAGFGRELSRSSPDGSLNWLTATTDDPGSCGFFFNDVIPDDDAVALCAGTPTGSICTGDSGGGLVTTGGTPTLVGVVSAGRPGCDLGTSAVFTYVGAPEILRFIEGDDAPPVAPRRNSNTFVDISWHGPLSVGNTLTCASGNWDGQPALGYAFVSSQSGQVLQEGSRPTFAIATRDAGDTVYCRVLATNDGGTAVLRTEATAAIAGAPRLGIASLAPVAAVRGSTVKVRIVLRTAAPGLSGKFGVCITPPARVGSRVCSSQFVDDGTFGGFPFTLGLRIKPTAPPGAARLAISAVAGVSRAETTALVRVT